MTGTAVGHPGVDERRALGRAARMTSPASGHAGWVPAAGRPEPIGLLEEQNLAREADLVPVRHGRMMVPPFTFYRGVAEIMAAYLKDTPTAGLIVQLCGDAHLSNFGVFASPERTLLFDLNDFVPARERAATYGPSGDDVRATIQRGHPRLHRPAPGPGPGGSALPAGEERSSRRSGRDAWKRSKEPEPVYVCDSPLSGTRRPWTITRAPDGPGRLLGARHA